MTDEYTRAIAAIQGALSELMSCYVAGRKTEEARAGLDSAIERARDTQRDFEKKNTALVLAIARAEASIPPAPAGASIPVQIK